MADKKFEILDGFDSQANSNVNATLTSSQLEVTGNVAVDTDTLIVDSTNDRVGVNKVPTTALDVSGTVTATAFSGNGALITNLDVANIPDLTDNFLSSQDADSYESGGILSIANSSTLQVTSGSIKLSDDQTLVFGNGGDAILSYATSSGFKISANTVTTRIVGQFNVSRNESGSSLAIGSQAGETSQNTTASIAFGPSSGRNNQQSYAISIGSSAGQFTQSQYGVAIGALAGNNLQGLRAVSVGYYAGSSSQAADAIAIGYEAGKTSQGGSAIAIGEEAGQSNQGLYAIALGINAANSDQGNYSIAIGQDAGELNQNASCIAIGPQAASNGQSQYSIAIGRGAGDDNQGANSVAIGYFSGFDLQGIGAVSIGHNTGRTNQNNYSIAIGSEAGNNNQRTGSIAIGRKAGYINQGANSIHISSKATNDVITTNNHIWIASPEANLMYTSANSWLFETPTVANTGVYYNENYYNGAAWIRQPPSPDLTIYKYSSNTSYYGDQLANDFLMLKSEQYAGNAELTFQHTGQYFKIYARQQTSDLPWGEEGLMLSAATYGQSNTSVDGSVFIDSFGGAVDLTGYTTIQKIDSDSYGKVLTVGNFTYSSANSTAPMHFSQFANVASYPGGGANVGSTRWVYENGVVGTPEAHSNWMWTEPGANLHIGTFLFYSNSNNYYNYKTAIKIVPNKLSNISVQPYPILQYAGSDRLKITYQGGTLYGTLTQTSALKYKENVRDITSGEVIDNLRPIIYDSKDGATINMPGLIADEVANSIPEIVTYDDEGNVDGLTYDRIIPHMIKKIQELSQEIEALKGNA